jgi:oligopeptide transport system substrate-binding protein
MYVCCSKEPKMLRKTVYLLLTSVLLFGCKSGDDTNVEILTGRGGIVYGGQFRFYSAEKVGDLFPLTVNDVYAQRVTSQIFQGLLRINPEGTVAEPCLASSYQVSEDAKVFTFEIRKGVFFQDNDCFSGGKGREITAEDFKYCFEMACSNNPKRNQSSWLLIDRIKGAKEFFDGKAKSVSGLRVKSAYEFEIELVESFAGFDKVLTHSSLVVFPKEAVEKYGDDIHQNPVGTGPFVLKELNDQQVELVRNANYWEQDEFGNQLPYLASILIQFNGKKIDELMAFRNKEIDLVLEIPVDEIQNVLGTLIEAQEGKNVKHRVASVNSLSVEYIGFAHVNSVFSDKRVRQAFHLAIDRNTIVDRDLNGDVIAVENGFVPFMTGYPIKSVKGHTFDPNRAKALLKEVGYPDGRGFPVVDFYVNTSETSPSYKMAEAVVRALRENLNITVQIKNVSYQEREDAIRSGKAAMWRGGWLADYPDPENFLSIFVSNAQTENISIINPFKYNSAEFDELFARAKRETNAEERMKLYAKCDQLLVDDAVVVPLFNKDFITMVNLKAKKFETNQMERLDFTRVYIKELTEQ